MSGWFEQMFSRSLAGRLLLVFALCTGLMWIGLMIWAIVSGLEGGREEAAEELRTYATQVLSVVTVFAGNPDQLNKAVGQVEKHENEGIAGDGGLFQIQIWLDGKTIRPSTLLPNTVPVAAGFEEAVHQGRRWWTQTQTSPDSSRIVRLSVTPGENVSILASQGIFALMPLVVSLPLLLIPAWFMTRFGLKPLGRIVRQIGDRVHSGHLTPLPETPYIELNPIVLATNRLMTRLQEQLDRERAFVADITHEMKTPLAIVQSNIGLLQQSEHADVRDRALQDLNAGVQRSNHLIGQLLRMARLEPSSSAHQARRIDLAEFVRERCAQLEPLASKRGLQLQVDTPDSESLDTEVDAMAAIIDNLLDNAIKYSDPDGAIIVSLARDEPAGNVLFTVEDQGPGIAQADRDLAFDRFRRLKSDQASGESAGAGLGLSIVHRACDRLGGSICLSTAGSGRGLRVRVTLPADRFPARTSASSKPDRATDA